MRGAPSSVVRHSRMVYVEDSGRLISETSCQARHLTSLGESALRMRCMSTAKFKLLTFCSLSLLDLLSPLWVNRGFARPRLHYENGPACRRFL